MQLERKMIGLEDEKKTFLRKSLEHEEMLIQIESRKQISTADFESLSDVRLVRKKTRDAMPKPQNATGT